MPKLVFIGHSHVHIVWDALMARRSAGTWPENIAASVIPLALPEYQPNVILDPTGGNDHQLGESVRTSLNGATDGDDCFVLSFIGGIYHHVISLAEHQIPYDFVLPEYPDLPLLPGREVIPTTVIRHVISQYIAEYRVALQLVHEATSAPVFHFEPPPPIGSDERVRSQPGVSFEERMAEHGPAPALLRRKAWLAHTGILREACQSLGVRYVAAPREAFDENGFLAERAWYSEDPIHANKWYGDLVLRQIFALIGIDDPVGAA